MAGMPRESSFMPTIKCSACGLQVEISMMGEHLCGGPEAQSQPAPGPSSFDNFMPEKLPRMMPPSLDTSAANRSFAGQGQLTPDQDGQTITSRLG
ncbi:hypothetical protein NKR19_g481 [Coniochaeta hoffmannii]|uniref:Uncharacterized protein n=1 Tax=Coniochaeta hoffmannii TaxID=91930 RepID=A0AA38SEG7_9PEZI|nr:hypothetical protein NKR19_g481 [Coniochaeta hoffmannii]